MKKWVRGWGCVIKKMDFEWEKPYPKGFIAGQTVKDFRPVIVALKGSGGRRTGRVSRTRLVAKHTCNG